MHRLHHPAAADVATAGYPYPTRDWSAPLDHAQARQLLSEIRQWWLAVAEGYLRLADQGCRESLADAQRALAISKLHAPNRKAVA